MECIPRMEVDQWAFGDCSSGVQGLACAGVVWLSFPASTVHNYYSNCRDPR